MSGQGKLIYRAMGDTIAWVSIELREMGQHDYRIYTVRHLATWGVPAGRTELDRAKSLVEAKALYNKHVKLLFK